MHVLNWTENRLTENFTQPHLTDSVLYPVKPGRVAVILAHQSNPVNPAHAKFIRLAYTQYGTRRAYAAFEVTQRVDQILSEFYHITLHCSRLEAA